MKLRIKDGFIYNEEDSIIAILTDEVTEAEERTIELGSEAVPAIEKFITEVNSGKFKPRAAVKEFEKLLEKHPPL